jgi:MFS family permease
VLLGAMGLFGGLMFTIYPVSVARTHDVFGARKVVAVSSALLLCYGLGATVGPVAASGLMAAGGPRGLFAYCALVSGCYAIFVYVFRKKEKIVLVPATDHVDFVPLPDTSTVAVRMNPRSAPGTR